MKILFGKLRLPGYFFIGSFFLSNGALSAKDLLPDRSVQTPARSVGADLSAAAASAPPVAQPSAPLSIASLKLAEGTTIPLEPLMDSINFYLVKEQWRHLAKPGTPVGKPSAHFEELCTLAGVCEEDSRFVLGQIRANERSGKSPDALLAPIKDAIQRSPTHFEELSLRRHYAMIRTMAALCQPQEIGFYLPTPGLERYIVMTNTTNGFYNAARGLLENWGTTPQEGYQLNRAALLFADPYLVDYNDSIGKAPAPNHKEWSTMGAAIKNALKNGKRLQSSQKRQLDKILHRLAPPAGVEWFLGEPPEEAVSHIDLRKRIHRLWQAVGSTSKDIQQAFALTLANCEGRCADGISEALAPLETAHVFKAKKYSLGTQISQVIKKELLRFLDAHAHPGYRFENLEQYEEVATGIPMVMKARLRLPFGLPGEQTKVTYPLYGYPHKRPLSPHAALTRLFTGGPIAYQDMMIGSDSVHTPPKKYEVQFEPLTPSRLIDLVQTAYITGALSELDTFCQNIPEISPHFNAVFIDGSGKENPYFTVSSDPAQSHKRALFAKALAYYGYLSHITPEVKG